MTLQPLAMFPALAQSARGQTALAPMMGGMGSPGAVALVTPDVKADSELCAMSMSPETVQ